MLPQITKTPQRQNFILLFCCRAPHACLLRCSHTAWEVVITWKCRTSYLCIPLMALHILVIACYFLLDPNSCYCMFLICVNHGLTQDTKMSLNLQLREFYVLPSYLLLTGTSLFICQNMQTQCQVWRY